MTELNPLVVVIKTLCEWSLDEERNSHLQEYHPLWNDDDWEQKGEIDAAQSGLGIHHKDQRYPYRALPAMGSNDHDSDRVEKDQRNNLLPDDESTQFHWLENFLRLSMVGIECDLFLYAEDDPENFAYVPQQRLAPCHRESAVVLSVPVSTASRPPGQDLHRTSHFSIKMPGPRQLSLTQCHALVDSSLLDELISDRSLDDDDSWRLWFQTIKVVLTQNQFHSFHHPPEEDEVGEEEFLVSDHLYRLPLADEELTVNADPNVHVRSHHSDRVKLWSPIRHKVQVDWTRFISSLLDVAAAAAAAHEFVMEERPADSTVNLNSTSTSLSSNLTIVTLADCAQASTSLFSFSQPSPSCGSTVIWPLLQSNRSLRSIEEHATLKSPKVRLSSSFYQSSSMENQTLSTSFFDMGDTPLFAGAPCRLLRPLPLNRKHHPGSIQRTRTREMGPQERFPTHISFDQNAPHHEALTSWNHSLQQNQHPFLVPSVWSDRDLWPWDGISSQATMPSRPIHGKSARRGQPYSPVMPTFKGSTEPINLELVESRWKQELQSIDRLLLAMSVLAVGLTILLIFMLWKVVQGMEPPRLRPSVVSWTHRCSSMPPNPVVQTVPVGGPRSPRHHHSSAPKQESVSPLTPDSVSSWRFRDGAEVAWKNPDRDGSPRAFDRPELIPNQEEEDRLFSARRRYQVESKGPRSSSMMMMAPMMTTRPPMPNFSTRSTISTFHGHDGRRAMGQRPYERLTQPSPRPVLRPVEPDARRAEPPPAGPEPVFFLPRQSLPVSTSPSDATSPRRVGREFQKKPGNDVAGRGGAGPTTTTTSLGSGLSFIEDYWSH